MKKNGKILKSVDEKKWKDFKKQFFCINIAQIAPK
jgi:hypothetical protein